MIKKEAHFSRNMDLIDGKWISIDERRKYMAKAAKKHREKRKQEELEHEAYISRMRAKIQKLEGQCLNIQILAHDLENKKQFSQENWMYPYLFQQNQNLLERVLQLRSTRELLQRLAKLQVIFPNFNVRYFPKVLLECLQKTLNLSLSVKVSKHGKIKYLNKLLSCSKERTALRSKINKEHMKTEDKSLNYRVKTLCIDKDLKKFIKKTFIMKNIDYIEAAKINFHLTCVEGYNGKYLSSKQNQYEFSTFCIDKKKCPYFLFPVQNQHEFEDYSVNVTHVKRKGDDFGYLNVQVLLTGADIAIVTKTALKYSKKENSFYTVPNGFSTVSYSRAAREGNHTHGVLVSTTTAIDRLEDSVNYSKAAWKIHKLGLFSSC
eukprot:snap_masked-scaffold_19-processed-gene-0.19-mRNA-1 protein AED:1.00 eAED:1.00 QI:0/-1/0/0/-1/1/1/0/375